MNVHAAEPMYIVMEYARNGNLQTFLRANRHSDRRTERQRRRSTHPLRMRDLVVFALDVCRGMHFISSKRVHVHSEPSFL